MSKIELNNVSSGYNLAEINVNFQRIEDALNNLVLYRNPPDGEPNTMEKPLDVNGQSIINVGDLEVNGDSVQDLVAAAGASASAALVSEGNAATSESNAAVSETNAAASASAIVDWEYKGSWTSSTSYEVNNIVSYSGSSYICTIAHTSTGSFDGSKWSIIAQQGLAGTGTGDMVGANNLSELTNTSIARTNIGLGNVDNTSDANKPVSTATQTALNTKQTTLVSGTNIKTLNGESILGSGDLEVASDGRAKAWVNFNGTGTVAIRAAFNVSSITDNGTGDYTINFTGPMPDANYVASLYTDGASGSGQMHRISQTAAALRVGTGDRVYSAAVDGQNNFVAVFR